MLIAHRDGSTELVDDTNPARRLVISAGAKDRDAQVAAWFAALPVPVPDSVTRLQGRLALLNAGLLPKVEAAVASAGGAIAIWYQDAPIWHRNDPIIAQLAGAVGLTGDQVDAMFVAAAQMA